MTASATTDAKTALATVVRRIRSREQDHVRLLHAVVQLDDGAIFAHDLIASGATQRSLMLIKGFLAMLRSGNYLCGGALLRMQIDTLLRLHAASLFPSGNDALHAFLDDLPLHKLKAPDGARLTEQELCKRVATRYEWVPRVYARTSGFIHFSGSSVLSAMPKASEDRTIEISVGSRLGRRWKPDERLEAAEAFDAATKAVLEMIQSWGQAKAAAAARRPRGPESPPGKRRN
jgi:hypothetical protein